MRVSGRVDQFEGESVSAWEGHPHGLILGQSRRLCRLSMSLGNRCSMQLGGKRTRLPETCGPAVPQCRRCACSKPYDIHANGRSLRSQVGYSCGDIVVQFQRSSTVSQNSSQQKLVSFHPVKPLFPLLAVELLALCVGCVSINVLSSTTFASCANIPISPAAVLFFLGAPFPLLFAICRCSKRSSSCSL